MRQRLQRLFELMNYYEQIGTIKSINDDPMYKHYQDRVIQIQSYIMNNYKHKDDNYENY